MRLVKAIENRWKNALRKRYLASEGGQNVRRVFMYGRSFAKKNRNRLGDIWGALAHFATISALSSPPTVTSLGDTKRGIRLLVGVVFRFRNGMCLLEVGDGGACSGCCF